MEPIGMVSMIKHHELTTLACKMYPLPLESSCLWTHTFDDGQSNSDELYRRLRQSVRINYTSGICSLQFKAETIDSGIWTCKFTINMNNETVELGNASITVFITQTEDERLGWIVGSITTLILFLMIFIVVLVVCKTRVFSKDKSRILETASKRNSRDNQGYSSTPVLNSITQNQDHYQNKAHHRHQHHPSRLYENFTVT